MNIKKIIFLIASVSSILLQNVEAQGDANGVFSYGNHQFSGVQGIWKGFIRFDILYKGRACRLICPANPAPGNPWVWNARFPDWHTEIDSILLSEGFFIAYVNTDEFNGSPECVKIWDEYFKFFTGGFGLENRVSLEGVSRGGLYVYNFAKKYPHHVNCIYTEAPVCDFKSWPGGFGKGKGSPQDWKLILKAYGFSNDAEAMSYKDNPVDNLGKLADAKVPVLHMVGLNDSIVPPDENTYVLVDRYIKLGGNATVIPCTRGRQDLAGHHFNIETPRIVADFIKSNTRAFRTKLNPDGFHYYRSDLTNSALRFEKEKSGRVAFLGGSITHNPGWRDSVCKAIQTMFPSTSFDFINAGIPSLGSVPDAFRFNQDVLSKGRIDLLFVEAAVNDRGNGYPASAQGRAMEGIVRQARTINPEVDIVFMYFVDPDKVRDYNRGIIPAEIMNHEKVAIHYNISSVNLAKEVTERINNKEFTWEGDFINLHPSPFGQQIYFRSISKFLENYWKSEKPGTGSVISYSLPGKLDPFSYDRGKLISVSKKDEMNGWLFNSVWAPGDKIPTREGYVNVPMLMCTVPGKILKYTFKGTAIGIAIASGPDAGIINFSIDGKEWKNLDLFTQWSASLHLPWFVTLSDELKQGSHTLRLKLDSNKNQSSKGTSCRIRYFYINY
jgi:sialidase-1